MRGAAIGLTVVALNVALFTDAAAQGLSGVSFPLEAVADSQSYLVYEYELGNPSASDWSLAGVEMAIPASSGTPATLAVTGELLDLAAIAGPTPVAPHAEVGPIIPTGWKGALGRNATLAWYPPSSAVVTGDSVPPGTTKSGFGIRSTYLPGITAVSGTPTVESCCLVPIDTTDGEYYASPEAYRVSGVAVAPRYAPEEVTVTLLRSQLATVCTDPLWIDDAALCSQLADSLDATASRLASGNTTEARTALESVLSTLDAEREPAGPIEGNAYWLLALNAAHVLSTIPGGPLTLAVTADTYLRRGAPNRNQGTDEFLRVRSSGNNRALVAVDTSALSAISGPVTQAYLEFDIVFNANNWGNDGRTIDAHRMLVPWTHYGATWNCADDLNPDNQSPDCPSTEWEMRTLDPSPYEPVPSGTLLVTGDLTGTVSIDVTADVNAMLAGQVPSYGWIIRKTEEGQNGRIDIASSETATGPRLILIF